MQNVKYFSHFLVSVIIFLSFLLSSCSLQHAETFITETYELQDFSSLVVDGIGQVTINTGDTNSLTIVAEPAIMKNITYSISDETLFLSLSNDMAIASLNPQLSIQFIITSKGINSIHNIGSCSITTSGLSGKTLQVVQDAVSNITLSNVNYETVELNLAGGGNVEINGSINEQIINMDGPVNYSSSETPSRIITASLSGNSEAIVWAADVLNVETSENANFQFYGLPQGAYLGLFPENVQSLGQK